MEEHGKVIVVYPERTGVSQKTGENWKSVDFVIEVDGRYTRKVKFTLFGTKNVEMARLPVGEYISVRFEIEAHEWKGDYFNDLRAYDILKNGISCFAHS